MSASATQGGHNQMMSTVWTALSVVLCTVSDSIRHHGHGTSNDIHRLDHAHWQPPGEVRWLKYQVQKTRSLNKQKQDTLLQHMREELNLFGSRISKYAALHARYPDIIYGKSQPGSRETSTKCELNVLTLPAKIAKPVDIWRNCGIRYTGSFMTRNEHYCIYITTSDYTPLTPNSRALLPSLIITCCWYSLAK